jgi:Spy/CpxP family protein refolding chaperone
MRGPFSKRPTRNPPEKRRRTIVDQLQAGSPDEAEARHTVFSESFISWKNLEGGMA